MSTSSSCCNPFFSYIKLDLKNKYSAECCKSICGRKKEREEVGIREDRGGRGGEWEEEREGE